QICCCQKHRQPTIISSQDRHFTRVTYPSFVSAQASMTPIASLPVTPALPDRSAILHLLRAPFREKRCPSLSTRYFSARFPWTRVPSTTATLAERRTLKEDPHAIRALRRSALRRPRSRRPENAPGYRHQGSPHASRAGPPRFPPRHPRLALQKRCRLFRAHRPRLRRRRCFHRLHHLAAQRRAAVAHGHRSQRRPHIRRGLQLHHATRT